MNVLTRSLVMVTLIAFKSYANQICSDNLGHEVKSCPINMAAYAQSQFTIPTYVMCDSSMDICSDEGYPDTNQHEYFTFFDIDSNETTKFKLTIKPNVYDAKNSLVQSGHVHSTLVPPTDDERALTFLFNDAISSKLALDKKLNISVPSNGSFINENNTKSELTNRSEVSCKTALNYLENTNNCTGDLNKDIDDLVQNNAAFLAFTSTMNKLDEVIDVFAPDGINLDNINRLSAFNVILKYYDESVITLNVSVDEGAVEIETNMLASRTSAGQSFANILDSSQKVSFSLSYLDALVVAASSRISVHCEPHTFADQEMELVERVVFTTPDGTEIIRNIYKALAKYVTYQQC